METSRETGMGTNKPVPYYSAVAASHKSYSSLHTVVFAEAATRPSTRWISSSRSSLATQYKDARATRASCKGCLDDSESMAGATGHGLR